jgi:tripartite-type tricarboxylate transporter receptor subunit TctC
MRRNPAPLAVLALLAGLGGNVPAQTAAPFPSKPVRIVVPYAPGGALDASARMVATEMSKILGQTVLIENRPGGAGTTGADFVAKAPADGHTLCWCPTGPLTITPLTDAKVPYQPLKDLVPVSHVINMDNVIMARRDLPADNLKDLVALARSQPNGLTFGTPGAGGTHHLGGEWFRNETGGKLVHVPYKGENPAIADLLGGQIDLVFGSASLAAPLLREGKIKVLGNVGSTRSRLLPEVPTVAQSGYPSYAWYNFIGLNAPAGTPAPVVDTLSKAVARSLQEPALREKFVGMGFEPVGSTPDEFGRFLVKETATWSRVMKSTSFSRE